MDPVASGAKTVQDRREFLTRMGAGATVAPAVSLLLALADKPAAAQADPYGEITSNSFPGSFTFTIHSGAQQFSLPPGEIQIITLP